MNAADLEMRRTTLRERHATLQRQLAQARLQVRQLEALEQQLTGALSLLDELLAPEATNHAEGEAR